MSKIEFIRRHPIRALRQIVFFVPANVLVAITVLVIWAGWGGGRAREYLDRIF